MRWGWLILGVLAVLVGAVWTLQGIGLITGSFMTSNPMWLVIGLVVAVIGLVLVVIGAGVGRRRAPMP